MERHDRDRCAAHRGSEELIRWSLPYRMVRVVGPRNIAEHDAVINLRSVSNTSGNLTSAEQDRVVVALEHLRAAEEHMITGSKVLLAGAALAGVRLTATPQKQVFLELGRDRGVCVTNQSGR